MLCQKHSTLIYFSFLNQHEKKNCLLEIFAHAIVWNHGVLQNHIMYTNLILYEFVAQFLDVKTWSLASIISGVARGCGWQHIGAYVNLSAFYLFGIPVAVVLGFLLHLRGKGLWIGILGGAIVQTILLAIVTSCTNWQKQVCSSFYHLLTYRYGYSVSKGYNFCALRYRKLMLIHPRHFTISTCSLRVYVESRVSS